MKGNYCIIVHEMYTKFYFLKWPTILSKITNGFHDLENTSVVQANINGEFGYQQVFADTQSL